jgi:hypothetical protein
MTNTKKQLSLYWCTTQDHDEDWFVVATNEHEASKFHEESEGYGYGDATAEFVCALPPGCPDAKSGWPTEELLVTCGAEFLTNLDEQPRIVRIKGKTFGEGDLIANAAISLGVLDKH